MKRLVVCCDGTWDRPGKKDQDGYVVRSNVEKIHKIISDTDIYGTQQVKHYVNGVGANGKLIRRIVSGAIGKGLDDNIEKGYRFLAENFDPGDEIYLLGFSRGAYTARSLAGLIRNCGVLTKDNLHMVNKAFSIYRDRSDATRPDSESAKEFVKNYSHRTHVKFIGVWDTVGSLGLPLGFLELYNLRKYSFHDVQLSSTVEYAYHAMAIDERRKPFKPTLWQRSKNAVIKGIKQHVEQVWFMGVHCNVGGGYHDERLSDITLEWMISKARFADLAVNEGMAKPSDSFPVFLCPSIGGKIYNSQSFGYRLLGNYIRPVGLYDSFHEAIDKSVAQRMEADQRYDPPNIPDGLANDWPPHN